jgi:hypothetical protein
LSTTKLLIWFDLDLTFFSNQIKSRIKIEVL